MKDCDINCAVHGHPATNTLCSQSKMIANINGMASDEPAPVTYVFLSFCNDALPKGSQFVGAVIVAAGDIVSACKEAHRLKINPGGEVAGVIVPAAMDIPDRFKNRLLDRADVAEFDRCMEAQP